MNATDMRDVGFVTAAADDNVRQYRTHALDWSDLASYEMKDEQSDWGTYVPILLTPLGYACVRPLGLGTYCVRVVPAKEQKDTLKPFFPVPWHKPWGKKNRFMLITAEPGTAALLDAVKLAAEALLSGKDRERFANSKADGVLGCPVNRVINAVILGPKEDKTVKPAPSADALARYGEKHIDDLLALCKQRKLGAAKKWGRDTLIAKLARWDAEHADST